MVVLVNILEILAISVSSLVVGIFSTIGMLKNQRSQAVVATESNNTAQIQTIFDGYSRIVADLHAEVQRLHAIVDELYKEQEACEERNVLLEKEVEDVMGRLCKLEEQTGGK